MLTFRSLRTPLLALILVPFSNQIVHSQGTPIGFEEEFALAEDRRALLEKLLPGTEEYYYYHCLDHLHRRELEALAPLLEVWIERHGRSARVVEIENRRALLGHEKDPAATYAYLRQRLGLRFDHQRSQPGHDPAIPTRLDPQDVAPSSWLRRALERHPKSLNGFTDRGLARLAGQNLDPVLLHELLDRLERPDFPNLPALVVRDLAAERGRSFGRSKVHALLTLEQLEECAQQRPQLLGEDTFVKAWLERLVPGNDVDWRRDAVAREAYLERLQAFTGRLAPSHNSLKAHVLYHRLLHDRGLGRENKDRFLSYLRLPRRTSYANPDSLRRRSANEAIVDLAEAFPTGLGAIRDDESLVRAYLMHFFRGEDSFEPYAPHVRRDYLAPLFAETKILYGQGDMERWYSMLGSPARYEELEQRVEIEFAPTQRTHYRAQDPVAIDVELKNVKTLILKVFALNPFNYYRERQSTIDASIDLNGLVANVERTVTFEDQPLRRVSRRFELEALSQPGVYVVELIGNGVSSRALVHKGHLQVVERIGSAGHVLRVLDENGRALDGASVWMAGQEYEADASGEIVVPFSTKPGRQSIILRHGALASLSTLDHEAERYDLRAEVFLDREALRAGELVSVLVRPTLFVNDHRVSPKLLESVELSITAVDVFGVTATTQARNLALDPNGELVHEIRVPEGTQRISVRLTARVQNLSRDEKQDLASATTTFEANQIDRTAETHCPLLGRAEGGYFVEIRGKNGEVIANRALRITLRHEGFRDGFVTQLQTDAQGRMHLGELPGVVNLEVGGLAGSWDLVTGRRTYPSVLHGATGAPLRVPYLGAANRLTRDVAALFELRGARTLAHDRFDRLALRDGFLELSGLAAGDYDLHLIEAGHVVRVRVSSGAVEGTWIRGAARLLETNGAASVHVRDVRVDDGALQVQLADAGPATRVHVFATRYVPAYDPFGLLATALEPSPAAWTVAHPQASYEAGRKISDELRYILERRFARKFPGNMLTRPSLLLNPWALEETRADEVDFEGMGLGGGRGGRAAGRAGGSRPGAAPSAAGTPGAYPNLDFLAGAGKLRANLRPDAAGRLSVPLAELGDGAVIHVLAVDDQHTVYVTHVRPDRPLVARDRRLRNALDPARHVTQDKRIELVRADQETVIEDLATARVEPYDSLAAVHQLFASLSGNDTWQRFAFVLRWPALSKAEKDALYAAHACHELHFFLHQKDRAYFDAVVGPYLANKMHKTFLDEWLLDEDLIGWLEPWSFARLNVVERILLARRLEERGVAMARHVRELAELDRPSPEALRHLFDSLLAGSALAPEKSAGLAGKLAVESKAAAEKANADPRAPAAPKPQAGGVDELKKKKEDRLGERAEELQEEAEGAAPAEEPLADRDTLDRAKDMGRRRLQRRLYRAPEATKEYVEQNYWRTRIEDHVADLVRSNAFWADYAGADADRPFLSPHLAQAAGNFTEMMFALSVLDLPFQPGEHVTRVEDGRMTIRAANGLLLVRQELRTSDDLVEDSTILARENDFRLDDRYRWVDGERVEHYVVGDYQRGLPYGRQVVLTNLGSAPQRLEVLMQIPRGALPIQAGFVTRSTEVHLAAYSTTTLEFTFYFPQAGAFSSYPVHVSQDRRVLAFAEARTLNVVDQLAEVDTSSWAHVSQNGDAAAVLAHLEQANVQRLDLSQIAWRMREREFFTRILGELRRRHAYDATLWSYGVLHADTSVTREFLRGQDAFLASCGKALESPLVTIDPVERYAYQHIEYWPLFNARAHRYGKTDTILNRSFARQYGEFLAVLCASPTLQDEEWLGVTYYMLLQDRVEDALRAFAKVRPERLPTRIQYDYMRAYLDFFSEDHAIARGIAERYLEHPVERWRELFAEVVRQLDEAEGKTRGLASEEAPRSGDQLAATAPAVELGVEARRIRLDYRNVERCEVRYYRMDIELLFSASPFVQQESGSFGFVQPNARETRVLPAGQAQLAFDLPEAFRSDNVLVEVEAGPVVRRQAYYANSLSVDVIENYGQLRVAHAETGKPLPRTYVKVYARLPGGGVKFHKDGYTDLRGRFDYLSLSGGVNDEAERFAILVISEKDGALIREAAPAKQ